MALTNKNDLSKAIDDLLAASASQKVQSAEDATQARQKLSSDLAGIIDAYVQYQLGDRLSKIMTSVSSQDSTGNASPLAKGQDYDTFTRTS